MNATKNHIFELESLLMYFIVVYFQKDLQLRGSDYKQLLNKPYVNKVTLREQYLSLKFCQLLEFFTYFERDFGSFLKDNKWSVDQRDAKLLPVKL